MIIMPMPHIYGAWKRDAVRLEGFNVAHVVTARGSATLRRFICSLAELDNYQSGRWRADGDEQDRVPTTVGISNHLRGGTAVALVSYSTIALRGWMQPVRYSPYPRTPHAWRERFGDEKGGNLAGEGEVHVHTGCPIPPRRFSTTPTRVCCAAGSWVLP